MRVVVPALLMEMYVHVMVVDLLLSLVHLLAAMVLMPVLLMQLTLPLMVVDLVLVSLLVASAGACAADESVSSFDVGGPCASAGACAADESGCSFDGGGSCASSGASAGCESGGSCAAESGGPSDDGESGASSGGGSGGAFDVGESDRFWKNKFTFSCVVCLSAGVLAVACLFGLSEGTPVAWHAL